MITFSGKEKPQRQEELTQIAIQHELVLSRLNRWLDNSTKPRQDQVQINIASNDIMVNTDTESVPEQPAQLLKKARQLEKEKNPEAALAIYQKILKEYTPATTVYYERPAIILERLGDNSAAIEVCNIALQLINENRLQADPEAFLRRSNRLQKRLKVGS